MEGRFTRLFSVSADRGRFDRGDLERLADQMSRGQNPNPPRNAPRSERTLAFRRPTRIIGQFVDHDLTFDPNFPTASALTPAQLQSLVDFRTGPVST